MGQPVSESLIKQPRRAERFAQAKLNPGQEEFHRCRSRKCLVAEGGDISTVEEVGEKHYILCSVNSKQKKVENTQTLGESETAKASVCISVGGKGPFLGQ